MAASSPTDPFQELIDLAEQKVENLRQALRDEYVSDGAIEKAARAALSKGRDTLLANILGFDNRYGKWELDHCNGRGGNTLIGVEVNDQARIIADGIVTKALENYKPSPDIIEAAQRSLDEQVKRMIPEMIRREATLRAQRIVEQVVNPQ